MVSDLIEKVSLVRRLERALQVIFRGGGKASHPLDVQAGGIKHSPAAHTGGGLHVSSLTAHRRSEEVLLRPYCTMIVGRTASIGSTECQSHGVGV